MERKQYQGIVENSRTWWTYCCLSIFCEPITVRVRYFVRLGFRIEQCITRKSFETSDLSQVTKFQTLYKAYNIGKKMNFEIPRLRFLVFGFFIYAVNFTIRIIDFDLESKLTTYDPSVARDMKKADRFGCELARKLAPELHQHFGAS